MKVVPVHVPAEGRVLGQQLVVRPRRQVVHLAMRAVAG